VNDVLNVMVKESNCNIKHLRVDGGVSKSDLLLQFQSQISNVNVERPEFIETTSLGVAIGCKKFCEGIDIETIKSHINFQSFKYESNN